MRADEFAHCRPLDYSIITSGIYGVDAAARTRVIIGESARFAQIIDASSSESVSNTTHNPLNDEGGNHAEDLWVSIVCAFIAQNTCIRTKDGVHLIRTN